MIEQKKKSIQLILQVVITNVMGLDIVIRYYCRLTSCDLICYICNKISLLLHLLNLLVGNDSLSLLLQNHLTKQTSASFKCRPIMLEI